jgi:hypothetical protein
LVEDIVLSFDHIQGVQFYFEYLSLNTNVSAALTSDELGIFEVAAAITHKLV